MRGEDPACPRVACAGLRRRTGAELRELSVTLTQLCTQRSHRLRTRRAVGVSLECRNGFLEFIFVATFYLWKKESSFIFTLLI